MPRFNTFTQIFAVADLAGTCSNYQITFSMKTIHDHQLDAGNIKKTAIEWLSRQPGVNYAIDMSTIGESPLPEPVRTMADGLLST
jgi:hypothetical protein